MIWRYYEWYTRIALTRYGGDVRNTVIVEQGLNLSAWMVIQILLFYSGMGVKALYIFWLPQVVVALRAPTPSHFTPETTRAAGYDLRVGDGA